MAEYNEDFDKINSENFYRHRMRNLREDNDLTQEQVAYVLNTSQTMYARYERGANELPLRHILRLCDLYNVSADYLLGMDKRKNSGIKLEDLQKLEPGKPRQKSNKTSDSSENSKKVDDIRDSNTKNSNE